MLSAVQDYLQPRGIDAFVARGVVDARELLAAIRPDIAAVDLDLADGDAYGLVNDILAAGALCVVISSGAAIEDRVRALELGVDDYINKPIHAVELYLRLRNILGRRRALDEAAASAVLDLSGVKVDLVTRSIKGRNGFPDVELTETELALLRMLSDNAERIVTREAIFAAVRGGPYQPTSRALDVGMSRLRIKLKSCGASIEIRSVRQLGWVLTLEPPAILVSG